MVFDPTECALLSNVAWYLILNASLILQLGGNIGFLPPPPGGNTPKLVPPPLGGVPHARSTQQQPQQQDSFAQPPQQKQQQSNSDWGDFSSFASSTE